MKNKKEGIMFQTQLTLINEFLIVLILQIHTWQMNQKEDYLFTWLIGWNSKTCIWIFVIILSSLDSSIKLDIYKLVTIF